VDSRRLEERVLSIVELVLNGRTVEDDRVELKAEWPEDHYKAARHIAGLANASRGEDVLWIVGLDETTGVVDSLIGVSSRTGGIRSHDTSMNRPPIHTY